MSQIQFPGIGRAEFTVDEITDPGGPPAEVLDLDLGFAIRGTVVLPNWLTGMGHVDIYADEIGGDIDKKILHTDVQVTATPGEPNPTTYHWEVNYPADCAPDGSLPDPSGGSQLYRFAAVFTLGDPPTDIGGFVEMGPYMVN
jgi:hypothetical protein